MGRERNKARHQMQIYFKKERGTLKMERESDEPSIVGGKPIDLQKGEILASFFDPGTTKM